MTLVAGIDSSTQSCKVLVIELETGRIVRSGQVRHPDGTEIDPELWWDALQAAIAAAGGLGDVAAVSIAAQQHGLVALDAEGRVVRPALLWNDNRSGPAGHRLVEELGAEEWARRVGVVPVASITVAKLRWLRDAEPDNAARVAAVALPHDWLSWRLRGYGPAGASPLGPRLDELLTDRSDASGTGYWSARTGAYDLGLLEHAFGRTTLLPGVLGPDERMGTTPDGVVVGPGAGDNAAAALGLGIGAGDVVVSLGTSGALFAAHDGPSADPSGIVAGFADAAGGFLPLVCTLNAARVLDVTARLLGVDHDGLAALASTAPPGADGLVLVPYFEGERTPNRPESNASLFGLTLDSFDRPHLARAAIEGMLNAQADGFDPLVAATGIPPRRLLLIGGSARNRAVREIATTLFEIPIVVPTPAEYVACGAAVQAAWALSGARPQWPLGVDARLDPQPAPAVRRVYAEAREAAPIRPFSGIDSIERSTPSCPMRANLGICTRNTRIHDSTV